MKRERNYLPMTTQPALSFMELTTIDDMTVDQLRWRTNSEKLRETGGVMEIDNQSHQVMAATALNQIIHALAGDIGATPLIREQNQNSMVGKCLTGDFEGLLEVAGINVEAFLDRVRQNARLIQARKQLLLREIEDNGDLDEAARSAASEKIMNDPALDSSPRGSLISFAKVVSARLKSISLSDKTFHQVIGILAGHSGGTAEQKRKAQHLMAAKCVQDELPKELLLASASIEKFVQQAIRQAPLLQKETDSVIAYAKIVWARIKSVDTEED